MRFWDPEGAEYGIPTYPRRLAPEGLATRRQLRARGLRPGGQDVAAQILWYGRRPPGEGPARCAPRTCTASTWPRPCGR